MAINPETELNLGLEQDFPEPARQDEEAPATKLSDEVGEDEILGLYLREISQTPLLTAREEIEFAQRYEKGREVQVRIERFGGRLKGVQKAELRQLTKEGQAARQKLIKANLRLVIGPAKQYRGNGIPFLDLIQEGNIGLLRAVDKFDWRLGYRFATYATWWIRQRILRSIHEDSRAAIRLPSHAGVNLHVVEKFGEGFVIREGREPNVEEIAAGTRLSEEQVKDLLAIPQVVSLELPVADGQRTLGELVEDEEVNIPNQVLSNQAREELRKVVQRLSQREQEVLELRFGLQDGFDHTLEEVGETFGVTRERIRQIEAQALRKLRHPQNARRLRDFPPRFRI